MAKRKYLYCSLLLLVAVLGGCARAARDTTGFALVDRVSVQAPLAEAWQAGKAVLREKNLDIYTRDKRGVFVAYTRMHRSLLVPHRVQYTITMTEVTPTSTDVSIETVRQVYGVTLLTYPGWHVRKTTDNKEALEIIQLLQAKLAAGTPSEKPNDTSSSPSK